MLDRRWIALVALCLGVVMIVLDGTVVTVALPLIRADLGFTQASLVWVVNAYILTFGGCLLLGGRLGDLYGARRVFLIGIRGVYVCFASLWTRHHADADGVGARQPGRRGRRC